jgi:hypothetical protein
MSDAICRMERKEESMTMLGSHRPALCWLGALGLLSAWPSARADMVTDWNQAAVRATEVAGAPVPVQTRVMSLVHGAVFDAVNAIERRYTAYAVEAAAAPGASAEAAAAAAAHAMLELLYPLQKPILDTALAGALKPVPEGAAKSDGVRLGREVADRFFALRKEDGAAAQATYSFAKGMGVYQATPPMTGSPVLPHWRGVKPFLVGSVKEFAFAGPPPATSDMFRKDLEEIRRLGGRNSADRTNEQTAVAIHWAGSEIPPVNAVARAAAAAKGLDLADSARLFALLNMAMADALIAGFEAKYMSNYWRPVTAMRDAGFAEAAGMAADPAWEPLLVTPPHPEYPSAHALGAGAAVAVLKHVFGDDRFASSYVYPPLGVARRWDSFSEIEREVADSRVWGGIHFRSAVNDGVLMGRQIADAGIKTRMRPRMN